MRRRFQQVVKFVSQGLSRLSLPFLLLTGLAAFILMYALSVVVVTYSQKLLIGPNEIIKSEHIISLCSTAALVISAIIALFTLHTSRLNSEAPWLVNFREFHRDFWNDKDISTARMWICCDEAYDKQLAPVLEARKSCSVSLDEYPTLENLDRFCALMLRAVNANTQKMSYIQRQAWENLGYNWWLARFKDENRKALYFYIEMCWDQLIPHIKRAAAEEKSKRRANSSKEEFDRDIDINGGNLV